MSILAIDIGTTHCAAGVYARDGSLLKHETGAYLLQSPEPSALELDPEQVMEAVRAVIQSVVTGMRDRVRAMSFSVQGEAMVPVNQQGHPLGPALTTFDLRPAQEARQFIERFGRERLYGLTGLPPDPMYSLAKILWWRATRPDLTPQTVQYLCFGGLLLRQLGLVPAMDYSLAGRTQLLDLHGKHWSAEILDAAEIPVTTLPRLLQAGTFLGLIPERIAREYGLPKGVQVVLGGHDQACSALGCGVIEPGTAMDATGRVECLLPVLAEPVINDRMLANHYGCYPHLLPDRYLALAYSFSAGSLLRWYRDTFGEAESEEARVSGLSFHEILLRKASIGPSPVLVLPHFSAAGTPFLDPQARGAVLGLTLTTSKAQILKGLLDGLGYEMRLNLDVLESAGVAVDRVRVVGGGALSATWLQLKADIYRRTTEGSPVIDAPVHGAALLAGVGTGLYHDFAATAPRHETISHQVNPDPAAVELYERQYRQYRQLYPALKRIQK